MVLSYFYFQFLSFLPLTLPSSHKQGGFSTMRDSQSSHNLVITTTLGDSSL